MYACFVAAVRSNFWGLFRRSSVEQDAERGLLDEENISHIDSNEDDARETNKREVEAGKTVLRTRSFYANTRLEIMNFFQGYLNLHVKSQNWKKAPRVFCQVQIMMVR